MLPRNPLSIVPLNTDNYSSVNIEAEDEVKPALSTLKHKRVTFDASGKDFHFPTGC
jgi:hypothetical protein